ncbi:MAG: hypothetical protein AAF192_21110 [Pseudomonadota bacterium]
MTWRAAHFLFRSLGAVDARLRAQVAALIVRRADRWKRAAEQDPALVTDVIQLGRVLEPTAEKDGDLHLADGQLAFAAGRREMALELLALMKVSDHELNEAMERANVSA